MNKQIKTFANINIFLGIILLILPIGILVYYIFFSPSKVEATYNPEKESDIITQPIFDQSNLKFNDPFLNDNLSEFKPLDFYIPNYEATDIGTRITIPAVGLNTTVYESKVPSLGLDAGVWRDPLYGVPDRSNTGPIILAAHRWGEDSFSWEYRYKNLFTKFDQLKAGDEVTIIWNNHEYNYIIRTTIEGTAVTENADLIMYTCIYYNSPLRIFVYADLLK
jgi:sortase (surface protein transpeptidase)